MWFCRKLRYNVLTLTELHNLQNKIKNTDTKLCLTSTAEDVHKTVLKKGKYMYPAAVIIIILSPLMKQHYRDSGHVETRIFGSVLQYFLRCDVYFTQIPHIIKHTRRYSTTRRVFGNSKQKRLHNHCRWSKLLAAEKHRSFQLITRKLKFLIWTHLKD